jgi:hypothetical protein
MNRIAPGVVGALLTTLVARPAAASTRNEGTDAQGDSVVMRLERIEQWNSHLNRSERADLRTAVARLRQLEHESNRREDAAVRRSRSAG